MSLEEALEEHQNAHETVEDAAAVLARTRRRMSAMKARMAKWTLPPGIGRRGERWLHVLARLERPLLFTRGCERHIRYDGATARGGLPARGGPGHYANAVCADFTMTNGVHRAEFRLGKCGLVGIGVMLADYHP